jgi:hypothetical protein
MGKAVEILSFCFGAVLQENERIKMIVFQIKSLTFAIITANIIFIMFTINGCGTKLYGSEDESWEDGSYTATKWIVILFVPIIPICSYRVLDGWDDGEEGEYKIQKVKLHWKQVLKTYLFVLITIAILSLVLYLIIHFGSKPIK